MLINIVTKTMPVFGHLLRIVSVSTQLWSLVKSADAYVPWSKSPVGKHTGQSLFNTYLAADDVSILNADRTRIGVFGPQSGICETLTEFPLLMLFKSSLTYPDHVFFFLMIIYFWGRNWEKEREREQRRDREREGTEDLKQLPALCWSLEDLCCQLRALMQGSNLQTVRSWSEPKSDA